MHKQTIKREETGLFQEYQLQLTKHQQALKEFLYEPFSLQAFESQIDLKSKAFSQDQRNLLVERINEQYGESVGQITTQLERLKDPAVFTVTTGHQLSLFTGPLFFVYKILHVIRLAEKLKVNFPDRDFIPVYWMASEDHDFDEVKSVKLFNRDLTWDADQVGAVGRFSLDGLETLRTEFKSFFERNPESDIHQLVAAYEGKNYAEATRKLVMRLFSGYDLLIIDGDDPVLKRSFAPIMQRELEVGFAYRAVLETDEKLRTKSIPQQVKPREINLFYLGNDNRTRIEKITEDHYTLLPGGDALSKNQLLDLLEKHPQNFSPNVVLRPVYQEHILPNLCYTGGLGEIAYWLQLKGVFQAAGVVYPLIQIRSSVIWLDRASVKRMTTLGLTMNELFKSTETLINEHLDQVGEDHDLSEVHHRRDELQRTMFELIAHEPNLESAIKAEWRKIEKSLETVEQKLKRAHKAKFDTELNQIRGLKERLFPNNNWQERELNFFQLAADGNYSSVLKELYESIDPLSSEINVLSDIE